MLLQAVTAGEHPTVHGALLFTCTSLTLPSCFPSTAGTSGLVLLCRLRASPGLSSYHPEVGKVDELEV